VDPGKKIGFSRQISKKVRLFPAILKKIDFSRQNSEKFRFFRQFKKNLIFQEEIGHLQILMGKLFPQD